MITVSDILRMRGNVVVVNNVSEIAGTRYSATYPTGARKALFWRGASPKASPKGPQGAAREARNFC